MYLTLLKVLPVALCTHHHSGANQDPPSLDHRPGRDLEEEIHKGLDPKRQVPINTRLDDSWACTVDNDLGGRDSGRETLEKGIDHEFGVLVAFSVDKVLAVIKVTNDGSICRNRVGLHGVTDVAIGAQECHSSWRTALGRCLAQQRNETEGDEEMGVAVDLILFIS